MEDLYTDIDTAKTIAEHSRIIRLYEQTGYLDKEDAIKKFISFNDAHPDFKQGMEFVGRAKNNLVSIQTAPAAVIIYNLKTQLAWISTKPS